MSEKKKHPKIPPLSPQDKKKFCDLAKFFGRAVSQAHNFGIEHPLARQPREQFFTLLINLIQEKGNIALYVAEKKLRYGDDVLEEDNPVVDRLIDLFSSIKLVSIEFEPEFNHQDWTGLLSILASRPRDITASGGIEKLIQEKNVGHIELNPIKYELIGMSEKVVSEGLAEVSEDDLKELERIIAESETGLEEKKESKEDSEEKLLSLIDPSLKEDAQQSLFLAQLIKDPLEEVHSIIEAIRLVNKVGTEKAKSIISSINKRLELLRDDLYQCLIEHKEDETTKETYRSATVLGKELTRQIKTIQVRPELTSFTDKMTNILTMIMDQAEAQKLLDTFIKGEKTLKKKAIFLKGIIQRAKFSTDFEFLMKKLLLLKGISQEEINRLFDEQMAILQQLEKEKTANLEQELKLTLQKLSEKEIPMDEAMSKLNEFIEAQVKLTNQKLKQNNENLLNQTKIFNAAFEGVDEGVIILDEDEKIIFINKSAEGLLELESADKIGNKLLKLFKNWQGDKIISVEEFLKENEINENERGKFNKIISRLKNIRKDEKGQIKFVIFKPKP